MQSVFKLPSKEPSTHLNAATDLRVHLALIIDDIEIIRHTDGIVVFTPGFFLAHPTIESYNSFCWAYLSCCWID